MSTVNKHARDQEFGLGLTPEIGTLAFARSPRNVHFRSNITKPLLLLLNFIALKEPNILQLPIPLPLPPFSTTSPFAESILANSRVRPLIPPLYYPPYAHYIPHYQNNNHVVETDKEYVRTFRSGRGQC